MSDDADTADIASDGKQSKRMLFKDALTRTRSKFKKNDNTDREFKLSDDVNDFLAAGRSPKLNESSTNDSVQPAPTPRADLAQLSPRGIPIPRLDVSSSQRWPAARPVEEDPRSRSDEYLRPYDTKQRTQSLSSFKGARSKPRLLSVTFLNAPPVIIGEGGDEAQTPPMEISRNRHQRSRSLSPMPNRPNSIQSVSSQDRSPIRRKPVPRSLNHEIDGPDFVPRSLQRVQTGFDKSMRSAAEQEFERTLQSPSTGSETESTNPFKTPLLSPRPVRPPVPPPSVQQSPPPVEYYQPVTVAQPVFGSHEPIKHGSVQVLVTEEQSVLPARQQYPSPVAPGYRRDPNAAPVMPHQLAHRSRPSLNETETMHRGAEGWL